MLDLYESEILESKKLKERHDLVLDELDLVKKQLDNSDRNDNKKLLFSSLNSKLLRVIF